MTFVSPRRPPRPPSIEEVAAEARYARQRFDLYKAKAYSARPTNPARLRELQLASESAERRLTAARRRV